MELQRYLQLIAKWLWLLMLGAGVAAGIAYLELHDTPRLYEATTKLVVDQGAIGTNDIWTSKNLVTTYAEVIKTDALMQRALEANPDLPLSPSQLNAMTTVQPVRETAVLTIRVRDIEPERAARLANAIAETFVDDVARAERERFRAAEEALQQQLDSYRAEIERTQQAIDRVRSADGGDPEQQRLELARLQDRVNLNQNVFGTLLRSFEDLRVAKARNTNQVRVIEPAARATPLPRSTLQYTALALLAGLVVAAVVAFIMEHLDDVVRTPERLARLGGLNFLALVPRFRSGGGGVLAEREPGAPALEQYRLLRTNVEFALLGEMNGKALLVTSPSAGEGKTTTLANLAVVMARAGHHVIAVDADLRTPALHASFGLPNASGLSTLLVQSPDLPHLPLQPTATAGLRVLTSGPLPPNPSELLAMPAMRRLIDRLRGEADVVLFDSPAALPSADATALAARMDGVIVVVDATRTRERALARAVQALTRAGAQVLGVVINRTGRQLDESYASATLPLSGERTPSGAEV